MNLAARFKASADVTARQVGDQTVILDLASGTYYGLDLVGHRIWQLMAEGKTLAEIREAVLQEYDVTREALTHDLRDLADKLLAHGLITLA